MGLIGRLKLFLSLRDVTVLSITLILLLVRSHINLVQLLMLFPDLVVKGYLLLLGDDPLILGKSLLVILLVLLMTRMMLLLLAFATCQSTVRGSRCLLLFLVVGLSLLLTLQHDRAFHRHLEWCDSLTATRGRLRLHSLMLAR